MVVCMPLSGRWLAIILVSACVFVALAFVWLSLIFYDPATYQIVSWTVKESRWNRTFRMELEGKRVSAVPPCENLQIREVWIEDVVFRKPTSGPFYRRERPVGQQLCVTFKRIPEDVALSVSVYDEGSSINGRRGELVFSCWLPKMPDAGTTIKMLVLPDSLHATEDDACAVFELTVPSADAAGKGKEDRFSLAVELWARHSH
jgi:hypothetical protein